MLTRTKRSETDRLICKQNAVSAFQQLDYASVASVLQKHEQMLIDIQKELRQKVNRSDFVSGLSSKISLSDITNLSLDSNESFKLNQSYSILPHSVQQEINQRVGDNVEQIKMFSNESKAQVDSIRRQLLSRQAQIQQKINLMSLSLREESKNLLETIHTKGDRSELDKIMHLSSLLAIEFELIKKRFNSFQADSSQIRKQINQLQDTQEDFKATVKVQQASSNAIIEQIRENALQVISKTGRNKTNGNSLLNSLVGSAQKQLRQSQSVELQEEIQKLSKAVQTLQKNEEDNTFSVKLFAERLSVVQNYHESWFKSLKEIQRTKKQLAQSREDVKYVSTSYDRFKEQCHQLIRDKSKQETKTQSQAIKLQIQQACSEISCKVAKMFDKCAKDIDLEGIRDSLEQTEFSLQEKINHFVAIVKKQHEQFSTKIQQLNDLTILLQRNLETRLKKEEFKEHRAQLITAQEATAMMKKTEGSIKKEVQQFAKQQKEINQILCSQNVIARWTWTSGSLKGGNLVAWDNQLVNTLPQNFFYSKEQHCFKVTSGGIYRFELGFYAKKKPTIQIIINGQTIISAVNSNSYVLHHSSGKLKDISNTEVTGLTYYDFFTLQQNSRIAISYCGELGHGFLGLQRI